MTGVKASLHSPNASTNPEISLPLFCTKLSKLLELERMALPSGARRAVPEILLHSFLETVFRCVADGSRNDRNT
jgi:hypothetical protein